MSIMQFFLTSKVSMSPKKKPRGKVHMYQKGDFLSIIKETSPCFCTVILIKMIYHISVLGLLLFYEKI